MSGASHRGGCGNGMAGDGAPRRAVAGHTLWMFDFDNTLAPLEPTVDWAGSRRELQAWLAAQGVTRTLFEEFPRGNLVLYEALRARLHAGGDVARSVLGGLGEASAACGGGRLSETAGAILSGASAIIERHELAGVDSVAPAAGALELLGALRAAGATVAVVTSNSSRTVAAWLKAQTVNGRAGAVALVDLIVGRDSGLPLKPSPATLERALALCSAASSDAAFVGDSEADLNAAKAAAVRFYGISAMAKGRDRLTILGALPVFSSPAAMAAYLDMTTEEHL